MGERGLAAYKSEASMRGSLQGEEFPSLCEPCLGENPYIRMQKRPGGAACKICDIPFTVFSWRPGRGSDEKKSEICSNCSKIKNLCQSCILDLKFGLPSQLRDAVLSAEGDIPSSASSDVNRNFQYSQQVALLNAGHDPWVNGEGPNEKLLALARNISNERSQPRLQLNIKSNNNNGDNNNDDDDTLKLNPSITSAAYRSYDDKNDTNFDTTTSSTIPLPPGIDSVSQIPNEMFTPLVLLNDNHHQSNKVKIDNQDNNGNPKKKAKKNIPPPKPPSGPPPPEAFLKTK